MSNFKVAEFGTLRSLFWPIHKHEARKCFPMLMMIISICFAYEILRNAKDSIIVTASGAETIPFLKVWALLPGSILLTVILAKLTNRYSQEKAFYLMISGFLLFYLFFAFILYPFRDYLHPNNLADKMEALLPLGFRGFVSVFRNWTFTIFYVMCEMWGGIIFSVLFWGFANEVTRVFEAHRFYSVLAVGSNITGIVAGQFVIWISSGVELNPIVPFGSDPWEQTLMLLVLVISLCGIVTMCSFRWMNKRVLNDPSFNELHRTREETKGKLSLKDSFSILMNSKYLMCIGIVVVSYNLAINMVEVVWKDQLSHLYPSPHDYNTYMSNLSTAIGIVSTLMALFMAKVIHYWGWTRTALITPIIMLIFGACFFYFYFFQGHMDYKTLTVATPLAIVVFIGGLHNCFSKAAKYSVFDATKEIAFIPLSHEHKVKGKAAIDGVGSRMGKSGGSLIHTVLLVMCGTLTNSAPYVAVILMGMTLFWISSTKTLGREFDNLMAQKKDDSPPFPPGEMQVESTTLEFS